MAKPLEGYSMKNFEGKMAFVSGANRGLGLAFVKALLEAGASKVYAGARDVSSLKGLEAEFGNKLVAVTLDVTNEVHIAKAAEAVTDLDILVNNAGIATFDSLTQARSNESAKLEMDVNYFGTLNMIRAFSSKLSGGAIVNLSSIAGLVNFPFFSSYSVSKAAVHSLIQGTRAELSKQNTLVVGVYPGPIDTDFAANMPIDKATPEEVVANVLDGVLNGEEDIFPDGTSQHICAGLKADAKGIEKHIASMGA